jgi:hypothetical protein
MDFSSRGNRPTQPVASKDNLGAQQTPQIKSFSAGGGSSMDIGKASSIFILIATSVLVLALIFALIFTNRDKDSANKEADLIKTDKYQAVFLNSQDGQVYFGKLGIYNKDLYALTDIYYVRVENPIQPEGTQAQQANISLAKLGAELHCPDDMMFVSRDKVLYWENLNDDGQVVSAIKDYKDSGRTVECKRDANAQNDDATQQNDANAAQPSGTPEESDTPDNP